MSVEYKKAEDKASRPWPTKAQLSKQTLLYSDSEGRRYYATSLKSSFVKDHMEAYDAKTHQPLWVRLPPKTTSGGMPEEHEHYEFVRESDKATVNVEMEHVSVVKYSKERGTGFVIVKFTQLL